MKEKSNIVLPSNLGFIYEKVKQFIIGRKLLLKLQIGLKKSISQSHKR